MPVPGYEGMYEVSDQGRIRSLPGGKRRGPILKGWGHGDGHRAIDLCNDGNNTRKLVHQVVMEAFVGPYPEGMEIRHLNGNPADNTLENLTYGTPSENTYDRILHGVHSQARKTHCLRGHEFTDENTYRFPDGRRSCRTCAAKYRYDRRHA